MQRQTWASLRTRARVGVALVGLVLLVLLALLVVAVLKWLPEALAVGELKGKDRAEEVGRARTAVLATLAGILAATGAYYTHRTFQLNRATLEHNRETADRSHALDQARQITERFTRAIEQLGNSSLDVRLGGIYALERIARDSSDDHPQVLEVLTAYVREHARLRSERRHMASSGAGGSDERTEAIRALERIAAGSQAEVGGAKAPTDPAPVGAETETPELATDVQAAMTVLGRRDASRDRPGTALELGNTDLGRAVLAEAILAGAYLDRANLTEANLIWARLVGANLEAANLEGADLTKAILAEAILAGANLEGANLEGANLTGANLAGAYLTKAILAGANLAGAYLTKANLEAASLEAASLDGASLEAASLAGAYLEGASLTAANLIRANLTGANLIRANLDRANLDRANLDRANLDRANLDRANLEGANLTKAYLAGARLAGAGIARANLEGGSLRRRYDVARGFRSGGCRCAQSGRRRERGPRLPGSVPPAD